MNDTPRKIDPWTTMSKGIECFFDIDGVTIRFWASAANGKEEVWVDERLVSSKRNFRFSSVHTFIAAGHSYEVRYITQSMFKGRMRCELYRDGLLVDSDDIVIDQTAAWKDPVRRRRVIAVMLLMAGFGAVLGYFVAAAVKAMVG